MELSFLAGIYWELFAAYWRFLCIAILEHQWRIICCFQRYVLQNGIAGTMELFDIEISILKKILIENIDKGKTIIVYRGMGYEWKEIQY